MIYYLFCTVLTTIEGDTLNYVDVIDSGSCLWPRLQVIGHALLYGDNFSPSITHLRVVRR